MALDAYNGGLTKFNDATSVDAIRNVINEAVGGEFTYRNFKANEHRVFAILEEAIDVTVGTIITNQFDPLADIKVVAHGEKASFTVTDNKLFRVSRVSAGNNDMQRQTILNNRFSVDTTWFGAKIYTELEMFMAKRVDFPSWIDRIALSFANDLGMRIYQAITASYSTLNQYYGITGTYDEDKLIDAVTHVEKKSGRKAVVFGTMKALRNITRGIAMSDAMKEKFNQVGYIGTVAGIDLFLLPQAHEVGTDNFVVDDNTLLIVPQNEKIVKLVIEGQTNIVETSDAGDRNDQQMEYLFQKKFGVAVMKSAIYAMYKITKA